MGDMLLRDVDENLQQALRLRAAANGRSVNKEVQAILQSALGQPAKPSREEVIRRFDELRARTAGRFHTPAEELVRESRDVDAR